MIRLDEPWLAEGQRLLFRALLDAWSRPGTVVDIGGRCGDGRARIAVLACLCDAGTSLHDLHSLLADADRSRLGAAAAGPGEAAFILADAGRPPAGLAPCRGTLLSPERGATLVLDCRSVGEGPGVRLAGPGIDGTVELHAGGVDPGWWTARSAWCAPPVGVDLLFCDARRVACVPRSARVEG